MLSADNETNFEEKNGNNDMLWPMSFLFVCFVVFSGSFAVEDYTAL